MRPPPVSLSVMAGLDPAIHTRPAYPAGHSQRRPLRWSWPGLTRRSRFPSWPGLTRPSMGMDSRVQPANDGRGVARRAALRPLITRVRPLKQLRLSWRSRFLSWPGLTRPATGIDSRVQPANDGWGVARRAALRPLITRVRPLKQFRLSRRSRFLSWPGLTRPATGMDSRIQPANDGWGVAHRVALRPLITRVRPLKQLRLSWRSRFPSWPGLTRPATGMDSRVQPANDGWGVARRRAALRPLITRVRPLKQFRLSWRSRFLSWPGLTRPSIWPRLGMTDHRVTLFSEPDTVTMKRSIIEARHARGGAGGTAQP